MADLRSLERINAPTVQLGDDQKAIFLMLKRRLENDKPRTIFTCPSDGTTLVFTDGAYEPGLDGAPGVGSIGGVLFHWSSGVVGPLDVSCPATLYQDGAKAANDI